MFTTSILSVCTGIITAFSKGTLFIILLTFACYLFIRRFSAGQERKFLIFMFIIGVSIRIAASLFQDGTALIFFNGSMQEVVGIVPIDDDYANLIREKTRTLFRMGDSDYASARGYMYTAYARGENNIVVLHYLTKGLKYGWHGYLYIIGLFYYLFGYSPVTVKFINCILGALTAIFIYKISYNFNEPSAKIACVLAVFFPSLILWSTTNTKDTSIVFISSIMVWLTIEFLKTYNIRSIFGIGLCIFIQYYLSRRDLWFLSIVFIVTTSLIYGFLNSKRKILLVISFMIVYLLLPTYQKISIMPSFKERIQKLYIHHIGHVGTEGISYRILDNKYYKNPDLLGTIDTFVFIKSLIKGVFHFILEPFPHRLTNPFFLLIFPQMVLWYILMPFIFVGVLQGLRQNYGFTIIVLTYIIIITVPISLASGNIGTLFRHRDLVTPFYLIFAGNGLITLFQHRT